MCSSDLEGKVAGADGAEGQRVLRDICKWHVEEFAYLVAKLKAIPEGDGNVFDRTCLIYVHEHAEANPLDRSAVHPEAYPVVERILARIGKGIGEVMGQSDALLNVAASDFTDERFGLPTVRDILGELEKPGRDPRPEFKTASFNEEIGRAHV